MHRAWRSDPGSPLTEMADLSVLDNRTAQTRRHVVRRQHDDPPIEVTREDEPSMHHPCAHSWEHIMRWRDFILAILAILMLVGLMAYSVLGEEPCRVLLKTTARFFRYLIDDLTGTCSRYEWD